MLLRILIPVLLISSCGGAEPTCLQPQWPISNGHGAHDAGDAEIFLTCAFGETPDYACANALYDQFFAEMRDWHSFMIHNEALMAIEYENQLALCNEDEDCMDNVNCSFYQQSEQMFEDYNNGREAIREKYIQKMKDECCYDSNS